MQTIVQHLVGLGDAMNDPITQSMIQYALLATCVYLIKMVLDDVRAFRKEVAGRMNNHAQRLTAIDGEIEPTAS